MARQQRLELDSAEHLFVLARHLYHLGDGFGFRDGRFSPFIGQSVDFVCEVHSLAPLVKKTFAFFFNLPRYGFPGPRLLLQSLHTGSTFRGFL